MKTAARRLPPLLIAVLTAMWLLLNQSLSAGHLLLGFAVAVALAWASAALRPLQPRPRRLHLAAGLVVRVLVDIVRSNLGVARIVLGLVRHREVRSGFLDIPLDLRDPHGLAVLAAIVTATPGTVWVGLAADGSRLRLHVLDLRDESEWVRTIKDRYEQPLRRIFE